MEPNPVIVEMARYLFGFVEEWQSLNNRNIYPRAWEAVPESAREFFCMVADRAVLYCRQTGIAYPPIAKLTIEQTPMSTDIWASEAVTVNIGQRLGCEVKAHLDRKSAQQLRQWLTEQLVTNRPKENGDG